MVVDMLVMGGLVVDVLVNDMLMWYVDVLVIGVNLYYGLLWFVEGVMLDMLMKCVCCVLLIVLGIYVWLLDGVL